MCKTDFELHFCTCMPENTATQTIIHNKNSRRHKKNFDKDSYQSKKIMWQLNRYLGSYDSGMIGMMIMPQDKLTEEITAAYLLKELNTRNVFDFDYTPDEGDNIIVRLEFTMPEHKKHRRYEERAYMSFIFRKGIWQEDFYNGFSDATAEIRKGEVQISRRI